MSITMLKLIWSTSFLESYVFFSKMYKNAILLVLINLSILWTCRPNIHSNFNVEQWIGYGTRDKPMFFSDLAEKALLLNFYSPVCKPCIDELPALEILYKNTQKKQNTAMYLAVEASLSANGIKEVRTDKAKRLTEKQERQRIRKRLEQDISTYNIRIPILIMHSKFRIGAQQVVQATPETLLFRNHPLRLFYNFVGPLTTQKTQKAILNDTRFQFAARKLEELPLH